jgi:hypothetical protein
MISILRHRTNEPAVKAKIMLQQNLFTFLLDDENPFILQTHRFTSL